MLVLLRAKPMVRPILGVANYFITFSFLHLIYAQFTQKPLFFFFYFQWLDWFKGLLNSFSYYLPYPKKSKLDYLTQCTLATYPPLYNFGWQVYGRSIPLPSLSSSLSSLYSLSYFLLLLFLLSLLMNSQEFNHCICFTISETILLDCLSLGCT